MKIYGHKAIICNRSEYLAGMLSEHKNKTLKVPERAFKSVMEFIYTGKVRIESVEDAIQIKKLSQEYKLTNLQNQIEEIMVGYPDTKNFEASLLVPEVRLQDQEPSSSSHIESSPVAVHPKIESTPSHIFSSPGPSTSSPMNNLEVVVRSPGNSPSAGIVRALFVSSQPFVSQTPSDQGVYDFN